MANLFPHITTATSNPIQQWTLGVGADFEESVLGLHLQPDRYSAGGDRPVESGGGCVSVVTYVLLLKCWQPAQREWS